MRLPGRPGHGHTGRVNPTLRFPWATGLVAAAGWAVVWTGKALHEWGVEESGPWAAGELLGSEWFLIAWVLTLPLVMLEAEAALAGRRWASRAAVVGAIGVVSFIAALPVGLRFCCGDTDPVAREDVGTSLSSYALLLAGYVALSLAYRGARGARRRRARPSASA